MAAPGAPPENPRGAERHPGDADQAHVLVGRLLRRTIAMVSLGLLVSAFVAGVYIDHLNRDSSIKGVERATESVSTSIQMIMLSSLAPKGHYLDQLFAHLPLETGIARIHMVSHQNTVSYSTAPDMVGKAMGDLDPVDCSGCHQDRRSVRPREYIERYFTKQDLMRVSVPIYNSLECRQCHDDGEPVRGFVVAEFPPSLLSQRLWRFRFGLIALLVFWLILFSVLAHRLLLRYTFRPMQAIAQRLAVLAEGKFDVRPEPVSTDGLIGYMSQKIDFASDRLQEFYASLDARIQTQTGHLRESQAELEAERNKLRLLLDSMPDGLVGLDDRMCVSFANNATASLLTTDLAGMIGRDAKTFPLLADFLSRAVLTIDGDAAGQEAPFRKSVEMKHGERFLEFQVATITSTAYGMLTVVVILDRTARVVMDRALARQERLAATGRLAAGVAHEIGNPLSAISAIVQLQQQAADSVQLPHQLDLIRFHVDRIGRIVHNLTDLSGTRELDMVTMDLNELLPRAIDIAAYDPRARGLKVEFERHAGSLPILCRPDEVVQLTLNMILNALDAVHGCASPRVSVATDLRGSDAVLLIRDNGSGIPAENLSRIFEPFFTTKELHKGTGLGLSVAYRSVTEMGGCVDVFSEPGEGTVFTISFPRRGS